MPQHLVEYEYPKAPDRGPREIDIRALKPFPNIVAADEYAQSAARIANEEVCLTVKEKRTNSPKVQYTSDGKGNVTKRSFV